MGGRSCKPVVEYADAVRQMAPHELGGHQHAFARLATTAGLTIDKENYILSTLVPRFGATCDRALLDRLFCLVDANASGAVEMEEYVVAQFMFGPATRDEKLKCAWRNN